MPSEAYLSTAYLPSLEYCRVLAGASICHIENNESYIKQTYRNRAEIIGANGKQSLVVPVRRGSLHKTPINDIEIDSTKRWQQNHVRTIESAYRSAAFYQYYSEELFSVICGSHRLLKDLNMDLLKLIIRFLRLDTTLSYTSEFKAEGSYSNDYRYVITPKRPSPNKKEETRTYIQVFSDRRGFTPDLSIIDLLFNTGPDAAGFLTPQHDEI